ncbi:MAG TPA: CHASE3 domain-containing protein, partial [Flavobacterium sp.]
MKFNFEKKLTFLFILTTLVLVLLLIVFYNNNQKIKTTGNWVLHTQEVLRKNDKVLLDVLDIVTGPRAYFFSGDEIFLEPYYKSSKTIKGNIEELARLSMDNARQQSRIDTLKNSIEKHLIYTKKLIEIKKNSSLSETEKTVINHKGTYFTNKIRLLIDHINNEELFLLKLRKTENEKSIKKFEQLFFILLFFFLVILLLVSLVIIKNQKTRAKHEIELNKSKELFSNLFNHNPSAIVISRLKDEKIINTNNSFLELLGFSNLEEVIGKTAAELNILFSPIQREEIFQVLKENKIAKGIETTVQTKKGTILWISTFILLLKVDHESCLFSVSIDITERKKAEEQLLIANKELENYIQQLAESEEKFRVVLDSAQIGAWDLNLVKDTAWRSLLHDQIFGYDDFLPEWGYDIFIKHVIPEDRKHAEQRFAEAYSKGKFSMECRIKKADDTIRWISAQGLVYKNEKGELTKMMGIVIDITDRKNSEHQLKVITAKLKEAQTLAKVGNWDSNLVTNTDTWSDEAFKILGVDPNTTLASLDTYFSCIHPNDLAFVKEKVNEVFTTLKGNTFNHRIKRQDETIIHVL